MKRTMIMIMILMKQFFIPRLTNAAGVEETYVNSEELRGAFDFGSSGDEQAHLVRHRHT